MAEDAQNSEQTAARVIGRPFEKGDSRINRGGRPKKSWLTEVHEELLEEKLSDPAERAKFKEAQWAKLLAKGVVSAMTVDKLWERTEGKVVQQVEVDGELSLTISDRLSRALQRKNERGSEPPTS